MMRTLLKLFPTIVFGLPALALTSVSPAAPVLLQTGSGTATFSQAPFSPDQAIDGNTTGGGWAIADFTNYNPPTHPTYDTDPQTAVWASQSDTGVGTTQLTFNLYQNSLAALTLG